MLLNFVKRLLQLDYKKLILLSIHPTLEGLLLAYLKLNTIFLFVTISYAQIMVIICDVYKRILLQVWKWCGL